MEYTTPVGRIIFGDCFRSRPVTDSQTKAQKFKKDGTTPRVSWSLGFAIPKANAAELVQLLKACAAEVFPNGAPNGFAWKVKDGDKDVDDKGKPYREREGWPGCYVLSCSTESGAPQAFIADHATGQWKQVESGIKSGDHVVLKIDVKGHVAVGVGKPGLYVNPKAVFLYKVDKSLSSFNVDPTTVALPPQQQPPAMPGAPSATPPALPGANQPASAPAQSDPFGPAATRHPTFAQGAQTGAAPTADDEIPF